MQSMKHAGAVGVAVAAAILAFAGCDGATEPAGAGAGAGAGATPEAQAARGGPLVVHAVNAPLAYFAQRLGGTAVDVRFLAAGSDDPATWTPTDADLAALQSADLILVNGAGYARWRGGASLPASRLVDTSAAFADELIPLEASATHSHGIAGGRSSAGPAPWVWLDPRLARRQVQAVADALIRRRLAATPLVLGAKDRLDQDLATLETDLLAAAAPLAGQPVLASGPMYPYLALRAGFDLQSVDWSPGSPPDEVRFAELTAVLADHPATLMLWPSEPTGEMTAALADLGVRVVVFDPGDADGGLIVSAWLGRMQANVRRLAEATAAVP